MKAPRKARPKACLPAAGEPPSVLLAAKNRELLRTLQLVEAARANLADHYDYAPFGFVTLDAKGCVREINLTAARLLGRERAQLLTMPFFTQIAKPYCGAFLHHLRECRSQPREVFCEVALRSRGRGSVPVEMRSVPVLDPRHGDTVYRTSITDITERLRIGRALRESEERYRDLVQLSPDGILILDEGIVVFANGAALRLCGVKDAKEMIGRELVDWFRPSFRKTLQGMLIHGAVPLETSMIETKLLRTVGPPVEVEILASTFRHHGEPAVRVVLRDITRRKQAERQVLAISERERSGFGRDLHDGLCQTLTGISWVAEVFRNELRADHPEAAAKADYIAQVIRRCVEDARGLARGLCPVTMETSGLVAALHELTAQMSNHTRIGCALECDDGLTVHDVGVATNVYRIAQEAVANAIKHGKPRSVLIQLAADNGRMTLRVRDDGRGLPAKPKHTGMGLHTMRYRAALIGGTLEVRREPPRGTVVTCNFPSNAETS